jgi:hypothetical protein
MTKRYREPVRIVAGSTDAGCPPVAFTWRGSTYRVVTVLGHWREDGGYWAGGGVRIPQRDLWRVEARNGTPVPGVYELVCEQDVWRLDRIWD